MNQNQVGKIKNAGAGIEVVGLFLLLYNLLFIFIYKSTLLFVPLLISAIIGLIFLVLGWQIRKDASPRSKNKLIVTLILSVIIFIFSLMTIKNGGLVDYLTVAILASSILGLDAIRKINSPSQDEVKLKGASRAKDLLKMVLIAIVVIGLFVGISYFALK